MYKDLRTFTLAGFEPGILCSGGGRIHHYASPQGNNILFVPTFRFWRNDWLFRLKLFAATCAEKVLTTLLCRKNPENWPK
jgi:hypothetical protein